MSRALDGVPLAIPCPFQMKLAVAKGHVSDKGVLAACKIFEKHLCEKSAFKNLILSSKRVTLSPEGFLLPP